eukprot:CAMPEP_0201740302 /NCGR_PEP_ID=MMETSP0593-20130828/46228_1 /ASSEMBLY_ACC=CAM_ASM_000672 /TAXON_ID=267983 /ORGANISM="Skeletonema japonicum, Strain CCMP2506" /LENGTH=570 /DNA_ID=CAMNT_0048234607 /DNA_START=72 /DNA_END=1784 /DNA_ORIENTATION=-
MSFTYQYTRSSTNSSPGISRFSLQCKFDQLANAYPEFHHEFEGLKKRRRKGHNNNSAHTYFTLSSQVNHSFNAALTRALLHSHFGLSMPSLPEGRLCPPVPNRCNYVAWLKQLLQSNSTDLHRFCNSGDASLDLQYKGIDIGTGVSAIYPLLLTTKLFAKSNELRCNDKQIKKWKFLATDIDPVAIESASRNVRANDLQNEICVASVEESPYSSTGNVVRGPLFAAMEAAKKEIVFKQGDADIGHDNELDDGEYCPQFDFVMTNPPFYASVEEVTTPRAGDKRPRTDISINEGVYSSADVASDGGEVGFIEAILQDSIFFKNDVTWYTSLIAKRSSLDAIYQNLQSVEGIWGNRGQIRTVEFHQDNIYEENEERHREHNVRVRWGIAWTFERAMGRVGSCRVRSGLQSFVVSIPDSDDANNEISSRLLAYFSEVRDLSLKCIDDYRERNADGMRSGGTKERCITVVEERFSTSAGASTLQNEKDNRNLPQEGHFVIDAFISIKTTHQSNNKEIDVEVNLEAFAHTTYGISLVNKIRGPMPGEIGRTNRRWRRLLKRQVASSSKSLPPSKS